MTQTSLLSLASIILITSLSGSQHYISRIYALPGSNGSGSETPYIQHVLGTTLPIISIETPLTKPDMGQTHCEQLFHKALENNHENAIVHATSQGTATTLNYLGSTINTAIKGIILEAPLVNGNSAIYHVVTGPSMNWKIFKKIPGICHILPYIAKLTIFSHYNPNGKQPIRSIDTLPNDMLVIIIHSKDDPQLPFNDACALYYRLRTNGNNNVYFIIKEGSRHIRILGGDSEKTVINAILEKHALVPSSQTTQSIDLSSYQPDPMLYKKYYDELMAKFTCSLAPSNSNCLKST